MIKAGYGRRALRDRGVPALFALMAMGMGILTMPSTAAAFLYVANMGRWLPPCRSEQIPPVLPYRRMENVFILPILLQTTFR